MAAVALAALGSVYSYRFDAEPLSKALVAISRDHPDITVSFIYDELESYTTSARIDTDDPYEAIRSVVGQNPVTVVRNKDRFYVEALQKGRFRFTGRAAGPEGEPVVSATVLLLAPADSAVITFGITDSNGRFSIPCDRRDVLAKISCIGYRTVYRRCDAFAVGTVDMPRLPVRLKGVDVAPEYAEIYPDRTVFIPTARQKNSAQTGSELLNRMAIPQLRVGSGEEVRTVAGKPVSIYIDFLPASAQDLQGMRMADVRRVEYYDFPSDPRFQGMQHVINFIMQKYEYGGYLKGYGDYNLFANSGQLTAFAKFQYRRMTYDLAAGYYGMDNRHTHTDLFETYRLPQPDGSVSEFTRSTVADDSRLLRRDAWLTFKASYTARGVSMSNVLAVSHDGTPHRDESGSVTVTPGTVTTCMSATDSRVRSLTYSGYWNFILPKGNTLTFTPDYSYSHTVQNTLYAENGADPIVNGARDNSHQFKADLALTHSFGHAGTFKAMCQGYYLANSTTYSGTTEMADRACTFRIGPGVSYSMSAGKFYGHAGLGLHYDRAAYGDVREHSTAPWGDLSLQYAFSRRHSATADFHFHRSIPSANYRSAAVIRAHPLMSYTGNPALRPYNSYDVGARYTFIPSRKFSAAVYGWAWIVHDRYAYDYVGSPEGVLRTIVQPAGTYVQGQYGINMSARLLSDNLQLGATVYHDLAHNGAPYNWNRQSVCWGVQAYYYLGDFYFGGEYTSRLGYPDGCMVGTWMERKSRYALQAGWADRRWNVRVYACDFARWNWLDSTGVTESGAYDVTTRSYDTGRHCFIKLSATYTFGFGRKVEAGDEISRQSGASSGILK